MGKVNKRAMGRSPKEKVKGQVKPLTSRGPLHEAIYQTSKLWAM